MEYMIINHSEESAKPEYGTPEFEAFMGRWMAYNQLLIDGGHWIAGAALASTDAATTVSKSAGAVTATTDGPFAETKEQIGGFYVIEAADLDKALELAAAMPVDDGALEVRPIGYRPDA